LISFGGNTLPKGDRFRYSAARNRTKQEPPQRKRRNKEAPHPNNGVGEVLSPAEELCYFWALAEGTLTLTRFLWPAQADRAVFLIRGQVIDRFLADEYALLWPPLHAISLGGAKLQVRDSDFVRAEGVFRWATAEELVPWWRSR